MLIAGSVDAGTTSRSDDACRLLIVDDETEIRRLLADLLSSLGWEVIEAEDGEHAWGHLKGSCFHLILLDQRMPRLTGSELYRRMRDAGDDTPVILMSAAHNIEELAQSLGVRRYLAKPFDLDSLLEAVRDAAPPHCRGDEPTDEPLAPA